MKFSLENLIGGVLRGGVLLCAGVIAFGLALAFLSPGGTEQQSEILAVLFQGKLGSAGIPASSAVSLMRCGVLLLILLPVVRVALTLVVFVVQRDRIYVAITTFVLTLLIFGLVWGKEL